MECNEDSIKKMFARMTSDGWDTTKPLKWGFVFMHNEPEALRSVVKELDGHTYAIDRFEENEDGLWVLAVSKNEVLTPEKLHRRNLAFNDLASYCGVALYDGWDVGPIGES
jgi:hypothetical protein